MLTKVSRTALTAAALVLASAHGALALDPDDFGEKFRAAAALSGIDVTFATARVEGDSIILSDFTLDIPGENPVEIAGDLTFLGVTETGDGGYHAEEARVADIAFEVEEEDQEEVFISIANIAAHNIRLPADPDTDLLQGLLLYERAGAGPITIAVDGEEVFSIAAVEGWVQSGTDEATLTSGYAVREFVVELGLIDEPEARDVIEALGVERLHLEMSGEGTWFLDTGVLEIPEMVIALEELGGLSISARLLGYTRELYEDMIKNQQKILEAGDDLSDAERLAAEQQVLTQLGQLEVEGLSIRYDDDSLFYKVLDLVGQEQGVSAEVFASGLRFMVALFLAEIDNPDLVESVNTALDTFLEDPQNIEIVAAPNPPLRIDSLLEAEDDPLAVIERLGVTVRANQ